MPACFCLVALPREGSCFLRRCCLPRMPCGDSTNTFMLATEFRFTAHLTSMQTETQSPVGGHGKSGNHGLGRHGRSPQTVALLPSRRKYNTCSSPTKIPGRMHASLLNRRLSPACRAELNKSAPWETLRCYQTRQARRTMAAARLPGFVLDRHGHCARLVLDVHVGAPRKSEQYHGIRQTL